MSLIAKKKNEALQMLISFLYQRIFKLLKSALKSIFFFTKKGNIF